MENIDPKKLIILDRDGVINEDSDAYVKSVDEWIPIAGSIEAIAALTKAGFTICIATNQSGIARGYYNVETLNAMHAKLTKLTQAAGGKIHSIEFCPHGPDDNCDCRKPLPGMYRRIADSFNLHDLTGAVTVGDSLRDLEAGKQLKCSTVLVKTGKGERTLSSGKALPEGTRIFDDLLSFAEDTIA